MHRAVFLIIIIFTIIGPASAQVFREKFELKESENFGVNPLENKYDHRAIPVLSDNNTNLLLLAATSGSLEAFYLKKGSLKLVKHIRSAVPDVRQLNSMIGAFQMDSMKYAAIFTDKKQDNFVAYEIDLAADTIRSTDFSFGLVNEKILHTFNADGDFFILTVAGRSSTLKLYRIFNSQRGNISLSRYAYDFSSSAQDNTLPSLYKELLEFVVRGNQQIVKLREEEAPSPVAAGSYFKLYFSDEKAILTMDHIHGRTSIYEMILDSKLKDFSLVPYPDYITNNPYRYTTNSILKNDTLVQLAIGKESLELFVHDIASDTMITEFSISTEAMKKAASNLIYRNDTVGINKQAKNFGYIYKDLYKNKVAISVHQIEAN
ncbi:MAG: hypothetical protein WBA74_10680, partial [Cyclobacteriaceae bacterium]